jgi:hypothetical protein
MEQRKIAKRIVDLCDPGKQSIDYPYVSPTPKYLWTCFAKSSGKVGTARLFSLRGDYVLEVNLAIVNIFGWFHRSLLWNFPALILQLLEMKALHIPLPVVRFTKEYTSLQTRKPKISRPSELLIVLYFSSLPVGVNPHRGNWNQAEGHSKFLHLFSIRVGQIAAKPITEFYFTEYLTWHTLSRLVVIKVC